MAIAHAAEADDGRSELLLECGEIVSSGRARFVMIYVLKWSREMVVTV